MAQYLNPYSSRQFLDLNGDPYVGALLFTYVAGSSTKVTCTKDSAGASNHTNPIVLNARGEISDGAGASQALWQPGGTSIKLVLAPSTDSDPPLSAISTWDNLSGINDTTITIDQWITGPTPTYVSGTQFTLVGDQTSTFHVGRRIKATVTAGTVYGVITVSAYTALTTITVVLDSGALDSGLSAVYYGLLTATGTSIPGVEISGDDWTHQGNVTVEGTLTMTAKAINEAKGAAVASVAGTTDIWTPADGNTVHITGTNAIDSFGTAPQAGAVRHIICDAAFSLTDGANLVCPGNANITCAADDAFDVYADTTTKMYVLNYTRANGSPLMSVVPNIQTFDTAGADTWTKPSGYSASAKVLVEAWGAGASGGLATGASLRAGGGGPGSYKQLWTVLSVLGVTESVTVGAGGASRVSDGDGNNGGPSSLGSLITAYGGAGGGSNNGGTDEVGGSAGGMTAGGTAGAKNNDLATTEGWGGDGATSQDGVHGFFTGGGGAGVTAAGVRGVGGSSLYGGGGGGAATAAGGTAGGTSTNGGAGSAGANNATPGTQPGGGGGAGIGGSHNSGAGGDGRVRVTVFPG